MTKGLIVPIPALIFLIAISWLSAYSNELSNLACDVATHSRTNSILHEAKPEEISQ